MKIFRYCLAILLATLAMLAPDAFAAGSGPDFSALTGVIDFSTTTAAILGVLGGLAGVFMIVRGGSLILEKLRR